MEQTELDLGLEPDCLTLEDVERDNFLFHLFLETIEPCPLPDAEPHHSSGSTPSQTSQTS